MACSFAFNASIFFKQKAILGTMSLDVSVLPFSEPDRIRVAFRNRGGVSSKELFLGILVPTELMQALRLPSTMTIYPYSNVSLGCVFFHRV